ncbi:MAG: conserved rane protein of unknown function [Acidimicrobiales bacterium]|nr:conserved rane protein of unknown function [Acidimicrobiales bacterium]
MTVVLALGAAMVFGSADFLGGIAARRTTPLVVALGSQLCGLSVLALALPLMGSATHTPGDLLLGAVAGVFGAAGLVLVYRALARGPMSVVAPTTALSAAVVPVVAGLLLGERLGWQAIVGIGVAFGAVALLTREHGGGHRPRASTSAVGTSLFAGALLGVFFVFLHATSAHAGLWPLVGARVASISLLAAIVGGQRVSLSVPRRGLAALALSGALDMLANVLYLLAVRRGMLAVVAALTALYPASTVILAQTVLSERMRRVQLVGLALAGVAAALIAT